VKKQNNIKCTVLKVIGDIRDLGDGLFSVKVKYNTEKVKAVKEIDLKLYNIFLIKEVKKGFKFILAKNDK